MGLFRQHLFLFKGGTCLIKCYLGYFRFSEDIDFTWRNQDQFKGMSQKEIRRYLSSVIDETGIVFEGISEKRGFDLSALKTTMIMLNSEEAIKQSPSKYGMILKS